MTHQHIRGPTPAELNHFNRRYYGTDTSTLRREIATLERTLKHLDQDLRHRTEQLYRASDALREQEVELRGLEKQRQKDGKLIHLLREGKKDLEGKCEFWQSKYARAIESWRVEKERRMGPGYRYGHRY